MLGRGIFIERTLLRMKRREEIQRLFSVNFLIQNDVGPNRRLLLGVSTDWVPFDQSLTINSSWLFQF